MTKPIISLIGYRGTGKTTVARLLAERLEWSWSDTDVEIERRAGKSIKEIFAAGGEAAFRDLESMVVQDLAQAEHVVVSLGGGAILREVNRRVLKRGPVVWLTADPSTIFSRMAADATSTERRPNLTAAGGLDEVTRLLAERMPLYRDCADFEVDTVNKSPAEVAHEIVCLLKAVDLP